MNCISVPHSLYLTACEMENCLWFIITAAELICHAAPCAITFENL